MAGHRRTLSGMVVVLTGASSGIGRATALEAARRGARLALVARGRRELAAVRAEVEALGPRRSPCRWMSPPTRPCAARPRRRSPASDASMPGSTMRALPPTRRSPTCRSPITGASSRPTTGARSTARWPPSPISARGRARPPRQCRLGQRRRAGAAAQRLFRLEARRQRLHRRTAHGASGSRRPDRRRADQAVGHCQRPAPPRAQPPRRRAARHAAALRTRTRRQIHLRRAWRGPCARSRSAFPRPPAPRHGARPGLTDRVIAAVVPPLTHSRRP